MVGCQGLFVIILVSLHCHLKVCHCEIEQFPFHVAEASIMIGGGIVYTLFNPVLLGSLLIASWNFAAALSMLVPPRFRY